MEVFITNAQQDRVVLSASIPFIIDNYTQLEISVDTTPRDGVERPGWIRIAFEQDTDGSHPASNQTIRFPSYADAGHMVPTRQAEDLAHDVEQWLRETSPD